MLDGPRPSAADVARLRDALVAERTALADLKSARRAVNSAIRLARSGNASFTAIAAAILPATGDRRLEHLAHLVGATAESVRAAVDAGDKIAAELIVHRAGS